mgnify:CR=1 FL=1
MTYNNSKNYRHLISVTSKEVKIDGLTLKSEEQISILMADLDAAKNTMREMRKVEEKLQQLKDSFNGKVDSATPNS